MIHAGDSKASAFALDIAWRLLHRSWQSSARLEIVLPPLPQPNHRPPERLPLAGQVVVFTGKLSALSRKDAQALVQRLGGLCADEVTARTTLLVVGSDKLAARETGGDDSDKTSKLRKAEQVNARTPGSVTIANEQNFCQMTGLPAPEDLAQQFYALRDIRSMYPRIREDHVRYLEKWGLIHATARNNTDAYYGFSDLLVIKQAHADLA
ncbi:MAG: BRCT domain-containing protein, partial [Acidobacteria bacterium]|nr:BRCT domain-containing protein [Acidobacteriota bacterium]